MQAQVLNEYEKLGNVIRAAEDWSPVYTDDVNSFAQLIKAESKLDRVLLEYFKGLSDRAINYIDWNLYAYKLAEVTAAAEDFSVEVIVKELPDEEDGLVMKITYEPMAMAVASSLQSAEATYKIILPEQSVPQVIERVARDRIAYLVGKRVDKDGNIIPAKNPEYHINEVTRQQIRESIRTSINLSETQAEATARLQKTIKDPKRAARIASTEAVNAFQGGQYEYAKLTNAIGKEWLSLSSACVRCSENAKVGVIDIDGVFPSGHKKPSAHPFDRCGLRYVYEEGE